MLSVYTIGPRSWRPDSSLANKVEDQQVANHMKDERNVDMLALVQPSTSDKEEEDEIKVLSYKWSAQDHAR